LILGMFAAAIHHGISLASGSVPGVKGGYFGTHIVYRSELGQTFWTAIVAWSTCFFVTIAVSYLTRPRPEEELVGLVYSLTPKPVEIEKHWYQKPSVLAVIVLSVTLVLNIIFF
jgi:solute:Na+ symporter, SSS family